MAWGGLARRIVRHLRGQPAQADYLGEQVARTAAKERRALEAILGTKRVEHIADIGCGPGHFTAHLAEWFPTARIAAVDHDPAMVAAARKRLEPYRDRVSIERGLADQTHLADNSFDVVISRLLYQHLSEPTAALSEAWRVLHPGGKLVITDVDDAMFGVVAPVVPEVGEALQLYAHAQAQRGGDRFIVRRLPALLAAAGFASIDVDAIATLSRGDGVRPCLPQLDPAPLDWLLRERLIDRADRDRLGEARAVLTDRNTVAITTLLVVHANKASN